MTNSKMKRAELEIGSLILKIMDVLEDEPAGQGLDALMSCFLTVAHYAKLDPEDLRSTFAKSLHEYAANYKAPTETEADAAAQEE